jgi:CRP-like cAMP-binding protein
VTRTETTRPNAVEQSASQLGAAAGLLANLAAHERNAIHRASQVQFYGAGDVLLRANSPIRCALFPINAVLSVTRQLRDGRAIAVGLLGNEGMLGIDIVLDTKSQVDDVVAQSAGFVYCMPADDLRHQFDGIRRLQRSILAFTHSLLGQIAQNAVCTRHHTLGQRLAKWLLMIDDRAGSMEISKSKALLAGALAADETAIERSLSELASRAAIEHRHSRIAIERDALEVSACECYDNVRTR